MVTITGSLGVVPFVVGLLVVVVVEVVVLRVVVVVVLRVVVVVEAVVVCRKVVWSGSESVGGVMGSRIGGRAVVVVAVIDCGGRIP